MTRDELNKAFSGAATNSAVLSMFGTSGFGLTLTALANHASGGFLLTGMAATTVGLTGAVKWGLHAINFSHRAAALTAAGRDAEPEASRPQAGAASAPGLRRG